MPTKASSERMWRNSIQKLSRPIDAASLSMFRAMFGALMVIEVLRYFESGWIANYFITPTFNFTYYGFSWVRPWPGIGMYLHFAALAVFAVGIALGLYYRAASALFAIGFTYVFLLEKAHYLNHFYVIILLSGLLACLPLHRSMSLDIRRRPELEDRTAPAWHLAPLRCQFVIVYVYAGIAKINVDWFNGEPLRHWLAPLRQMPVVGELFAQEWAVYAISYSGLLLDLCVAPLLLFSRTRWLAIALLSAFHLGNAFFFEIGIFPFLMLSANLLFLDPDWPRQLLRWRSALPDAAARALEARPEPAALRAQLKPAHGAMALAGLYVLAQLLVPLRHHLYPGDVAWTDEGHRFSWRMKLRDKRGKAEFFVDIGQRARSVRLARHLTQRQISKFTCQPDMLLEFAHYLAKHYSAAGEPRVKVRARVACSLNYGPPRQLVDPNVDLAAQPRTIWPSPWILR